MPELDEAIDGVPPRAGEHQAAREATRFMLLNPPVPLVARPGYALIAAGAVALLPAGRASRSACPSTVPGSPWQREQAPSPRPWCGGGWPGSRTVDRTRKQEESQVSRLTSKV